MRPLRRNTLFPVTRPTHYLAVGVCVILDDTLQQRSRGVTFYNHDRRIFGTFDAFSRDVQLLLVLI